MKNLLYILVLGLFTCTTNPQKKQDSIDLMLNTISILPVDSVSCLKAVELRELGRQKSREGNDKEAIEYYNKAIEVNPKYALAYYSRAVVQGRIGKIKASIDDYSISIGLDSTNANAYYGRGFEYDNIGDKKSALDDYSKAIEINPEFGDAYINRGVLKYEMGDYEGEIEDYRLCLTMAKETDNKVLIEEVSHNLGRALYDLKRFEEAAGAYSEGIVAAPENGRLYYGRGLSRNQSGDKDGACEDWRKSSVLGCFEANVLLPLCDGCETDD